MTLGYQLAGRKTKTGEKEVDSGYFVPNLTIFALLAESTEFPVICSELELGHVLQLSGFFCIRARE